MEDLTVKQLAEELGVSKPYVMKRIDQLGLKSRLIKTGNRFIVPEYIADQVRLAFTERTPAPADPAERDDRDDLIRILQDQLEVKDKQIERLQEENSALVKAIQQSNYLLTMSATPEPAEEPEPPAEPVEVHVPDPVEQPARRKSWFSRMFKR